MNKRGFTLLEILTVLVIISVVGTSSMLVFGNIDEETSQNDSENIYKDIQNAQELIDGSDTSMILTPEDNIPVS